MFVARELRDLGCHVPAAAAANTEPVLGIHDRAEAVPLDANVGTDGSVGSARAGIGSGSALYDMTPS